MRLGLSNRFSIVQVFQDIVILGPSSKFEYLFVSSVFIKIFCIRTAVISVTES